MLRGPAPGRIGKHQRRIRQALISYGRPVSTRELYEFCWPRLDSSSWRPEWRWLRVREAAARFATRASPRSRPLSGLRPDLTAPLR
jgi:hypothetical protein